MADHMDGEGLSEDGTAIADLSNNPSQLAMAVSF